MIPADLLDDVFLSTLSLRRATSYGSVTDQKQNISIHALLAESDSLSPCSASARTNFYPRSPCGERPAPAARGGSPTGISIHALLAESDGHDTNRAAGRHYFYPRSPCGERRLTAWRELHGLPISIHALLAESDCCGYANSCAG